MIKFTTGDILKSEAECLVNTVNCEGFMGKGIAYQFKLAYPLNEKAYANDCRSGTVKVGNVTFFVENGKTIANFPTKKKWREHSDYGYIDSGLKDLLRKLPSMKVKSIAIPPLGCGNGGLDWGIVKDMIVKAVKPYENQIDFYIYEPSMNFISGSAKEPHLNVSDLLLLDIKKQTSGVKFTTTRLQKTAYFVDLFAGTNYFKFENTRKGPYSQAVDSFARQIRDFQDYYNITDSDSSYELLKSKLVSKSVKNIIDKYTFPIKTATQFSNSIKDETDLEITTLLLEIIKANPNKEYEFLEKRFYDCYADSKTIANDNLKTVFDKLVESELITRDMFGNYSFNNSILENTMSGSANR